MDDKDDADDNKRFEDMYEAVPIQPLSLEEMFHHVDCSVAYKEEDLVDGQIVLSPSKLQAFKDYVLRARAYQEAYDNDGAWYFLGKAEAMLRFECGIREGIFRAGQRKRPSKADADARRADLKKKHDKVVAHMVAYDPGAWGSTKNFDDQLKSFAREIDFTLGKNILKDLYADPRITDIISKIQSAGARKPRR